jgi:hypothetical protein
MFGFTQDSLIELQELSNQVSATWIALVCGCDGLVLISGKEFADATDGSQPVSRFLRVSRVKNGMYRVYGNNGLVPSAKPMGVSRLFDGMLSRVLTTDDVA